MSMQITVGDDRDDDEREDRVRPGEVDEDDRDDARENPRTRSRADESEDDSDDDEEPEDGWAAEARRLRAALKKSNATGQRRRQQLKDLRAAESKADTGDDEDDEESPAEKPLDAKGVQKMLKKAREDAKAEAAAEHKRDLLTMRAENMLTAAGVSEKSARLLRAEIDFDDFADDPGEEIERLKVEFPDFFRRTRTTGRRINGGDDRDGGGKRRQPEGATARQVAALEHAMRGGR